MKALKKFEFTSGDRKGGIEAKYDWAKILDGGIYCLEPGKDYQCKDATFLTLARMAARKAGKTVKTQKTDDGLVIRAEPATKEQLKEWEARDAAKRAKKASGGEAEVES